MYLVQVDVIGTQALQGFLDLLSDLGGFAVARIVIVDIQAYFGGQNDILTLTALDGLAYHLFGMAAAIARRRINGGNARVQRSLDGRNALRIVYFASKVAAHAPGAQGNDRHVQVAFSQFAEIHRFFLLYLLCLFSIK